MTLNQSDVMNIYLQECVVGMNLSFYLTENLPLEVDLLRHHATGILKALSYLHQNNVVHRDLRDTSVFIDKSGERKHQFDVCQVINIFSANERGEKMSVLPHHISALIMWSLPPTSMECL